MKHWFDPLWRPLFAYDPMGNWDIDGRQHDLANQLMADATGSFDHDADGNLTVENDPMNGARTFSYDALGRLKTVTTFTETIDYRYDALGRRYAVTTATRGTTVTLFDGWQEIGSIRPDGTRHGYLSLGEFRLAADTASGTAYVHAGLTGNVLALTDDTGSILERYSYTAFGQVTVYGPDGVPTTTSPLSPWLFHGRLHEPETGLYWMRARHYHPRLGRFLQPDPIGIAGGPNLYAYANNNPLRWFDPWGLRPVTAEDVVGDSAPLVGLDSSQEAIRKKIKELEARADAIRELIEEQHALNSQYSSKVSRAELGILVGSAGTGIGLSTGPGSAPVRYTLGNLLGLAGVTIGFDSYIEATQSHEGFNKKGLANVYNALSILRSTIDEHRSALREHPDSR